MNSVGNINNSNEYYYLNQTEGNVAQTDENVSVFTDTLEEVSDSNSIQTSTENLTAEEYVSTLDDTTKEALIETLENIVTAEEEALNETKDNNGVIASAWDWVKNKTGIGQGSDKVQTEIDDLKSQIEELKTDPSKLAEVYENVTGNELTSEELTSLVNGEADFSDSKVVNSVSKYRQGQKQVVNTISSVASGIAVVGLVTAGVVGAPFTGGMSLGASLAAIGTLTAAGTAAYMVPQVVDGVTEADGYSASEIAEDVATGVINSAVTAASLGAGKAAGSALTKTVTNNAATIAATLGTTTEAAAQIGTKAAGLAAAETTSVLMSDGIAVGDYLVEAALNEDVDFSLETLGTTAASATAAGLAAGTVAFGTSSIIRHVLTSGTTASSQVAGRLVSSGISGAAAGASATAAAGSTSYLISCSVNGEEVDFDEWLDSTTENMSAGALTGFVAGVGFEAVQVAIGTPAPEGTASRQSGTTEDGLKYTEYLDKDGNVIARDVKVSDIKSYNSNSNNSSTEISTDTVSDSSSNSTARTVRFTYNSSNVIDGETGAVLNEYAKVNDVQVYDWADNMTFSAAQKLQSANSNLYDDSDIIDAEFVEEPVNYSSKSDVIIEQIGNETVVVEDGNVSGNQASVLQNSSGGQGVIIDADTGAIVSDVNPTQEITVVTDSVNPFELQLSGNLNQITAVDNSSALTAASLETSVASSTQLSSIAGISASNSYPSSTVQTGIVQTTVNNTPADTSSTKISQLSLDDIAKMSKDEKMEYLENKGVNSYHIESIASFDDIQYQRALELADKGVDSSDIIQICKFSSLKNTEYQLLLELIDEGVDAYSALQIVQMNLDDTQCQSVKNFVQKFNDVDDTQITKEFNKKTLQNRAGTQVETTASWDSKFVDEETGDEYSSKIKVTQTIEPDGTVKIERTETYEDGTSKSWYIGGDSSFDSDGKCDIYARGKLKTQREIIYNEKTGEPESIISTKESSDLEGVYEKTQYTLEEYPEDYDVLQGINDGTIEGGTQLSKVTTVNDDGSKTYTENVSSNGSNIQRTYTQGTNGTDYDYRYTITDETGTQILDTSVSFTKNSDNQTTTVINGVEYVANFDDSTHIIEITGSDGTVKTIDISKLADSYLEECWQTAKNLSSDSLETLPQVDTWIYIGDNLKSGVSKDLSYIKIKDNPQIISHELGHVKDFILGLHYDTELIKIYNSEIESFNSKYTNVSGQSYIKYFSQRGGSGASGLSELIAETNMLLTNYGHNTTTTESRAQFLAQNFPKTIAYIADKFGLNAAGQE